MLSSAEKVKRIVWMLASIGALGVFLYALYVFTIAQQNESALAAVTNTSQRVTASLYAAASDAQAYKETMTNAIALEDREQIKSAEAQGAQFIAHLDEALLLESDLALGADIRAVRSDFHKLAPEHLALAYKLTDTPDAADDLEPQVMDINARYDDILSRIRHLTQRYIDKTHTALKRTEQDMENARIAGVFAAVLTMTLMASVAAYLSRTAAQAIEASDRLKDEFLANTSHELRTPLHGIIGLSEALVHNSELGTEQREQLGLIITSGKRLSRLINDILDFSKLKEHGLELAPVPLHLHEYVNTVMRLCGPLARSKSLSLDNKVPTTLTPVLADPSRLEQVLHNLIGNAIKFTHSGSVTVTAEEYDEHITFHIRDTGIGISPEHLKKIFDSFNQGDGGTARQYGGTGLGLSITRQLVELHGGRIDVTSTVNQGSCFSVTLMKVDALVSTHPDNGMALAQSTPAKKFTSSQQQTPPPAAMPSIAATRVARTTKADRTRILVVDDEALNREILSLHLANDTTEIIAADDGEKALQLLDEAGPFDLVLLDVMMPRLTGYDVCETLRKRFDPGVLPVIFLTAKNRAEDVVRGFQAGGNDYLMKPFSRDELRARVHLHVSLKQALATIRAHSEELEDLVTERTQALINTQKQLVLQEKMATLGILSAGVAHEINNPNNFIYSANQTLASRIDEFQGFLMELLSEDDGEIRQEFQGRFKRLQECASIIDEGSQRITTIVKGLTVVTRLNDSERMPAQLVDGLAKTLDLIKPKYPDISFITRFNADPLLDCWPGELNQVAVNMVINACHAVESRADSAIPGTITLTTELAGDRLCLRFQDNGCGIAADKLSHIFDPFFTTKDVGQGTGLGLSICQDIVQKHGGNIEVQSTPGEGTTFEVFLPTMMRA